LRAVESVESVQSAVFIAQLVFTADFADFAEDQRGEVVSEAGGQKVEPAT
jgi:hypothetical protein